jgi:aryl-alcohol dehydrogenase-like predicted oxidoreductase
VDLMTLGQTEIRVPTLGVGCWQWGDTMMWGFGQQYNRVDVEGAFRASVEAGLTLFDTAEIYGRGTSERILGELVRQSQAPVVVASKFAPLPWRLSARSLRRALEASLQRLGLAPIDLYQVHWSFPVIPIEALMHELANAVESGQIRAVGVSNYSATQMRRACDALAKRGIPLASNQVEYSLLHREPEQNGVLAACRELQVTLIAYSPLAKGALTGKYQSGTTPPGPRRFSRDFRQQGLVAHEAVINCLRQIGQAHGGKTPAQVALRWLIQQPGVLPIPGAKNARQAADNAGALGWEMTQAEWEELERLSRNP